MKKIINLLLVLCPIIAISQTSTQNYIKTVTYKIPTQTRIIAPTILQASTNVTYFDGLGRPVQQVAYQQSASVKDIVTPIEYDAFGRQIKEYLPYASTQNDASYIDQLTLVANLTAQYKTNYGVINANPYSEKLLEASPLNRVLKQAAPGNDWKLGSGHEIEIEYQSNQSGDNVKNFSATATWSPTLGLYDINLDNAAATTFYGVNQLYKTITYDENAVTVPLTETAGSTVEFKNKEGQVILKRTYGTSIVNGISQNNAPHDTYYVYDMYGNLTYVIPPKADSAITQGILDDLCYQYKYDYRNRLAEKKLPGKGWEFIVYDKLDRVIATQDAVMRSNNKWLFTKYDVFNRPVYTGEVNAVIITRSAAQAAVDAATTLSETRQVANTINGTTTYYSNNAFPDINNTDINLFTINYYDDYSFDPLPAGASIVSYGITPIANAKGLPTGNRVRILGTNSWITNWNYYDDKAKPVCSYSKNDYLATTDIVKSQLDFVGKILETTSIHTRNSVTTTIKDVYTYDHAGRMTKQTQAINGAATPEIIAANTYDELGQLISKKVGGKTAAGLQTVDYAYNIRGWLKGINDTSTSSNSITMATGDLFGFKVNYNNPSTGTPLYNGNISQSFWKSTNPIDTSLKNYNYSYDALNRLSSAVDNIARYNESVSYDTNGNIMSLVRKGNTDANVTTFGTMDNLLYTYLGNRLNTVEDSSGSTEGFKDGIHTTQEYTYDENGNMKTDANKSITSISYNHLNLPTDVTLPGGAIHYDYDATGVKQRKTASGIITDYAGGFQYEKIGAGTQVLKFFPTAEGYAEKNSGNGTFSYIYQYKDHLGNVRLSYKDNNDDGLVATSEIVEESSYYPFGLKQKVLGEPIVNSGYKFKYNGKELQDELGLNVYDYSARNYDPAIGRWMNIDPLAEQGRRWSPYNYAMDNPIYFIDPDGMWPDPAWLRSYAVGAWKATGNLIVGTVTGSYTGIKNGLNATQKVVSAYKTGGVSGAAKQYAKSVYETSGAKGAVETLKKASTGDAESIAKTVVNVAAVAITHKVVKGASAEAGEASSASKAPVTNEIYKRPNNATTPAQRESVQGKTCVDCGGTSEPMVADHKTPLVQEHYETGTINTETMRSVEAVQPQCTTCSAQQGAQMSKYSKEMKAIINERTGN